jgi:Flp pilus assembly protein TadD
MERTTRARYATAAEFEADLRAFLEHRPVTARHIGPLGRAWRRVRRSKVALGAAGAAALALLLLGAGELREVRDAARAERYAEVLRHLPPNFTVVGRQNRIWRHEDDRAHLEALLDSAVELADGPLPTQLLRSSFRLDQGEVEGATADLLAVVRAVDTDYARALGERYAALEPGARGAGAIDLAGLPEPRTGLDLYLAAYHLLRAERYAEARAVLADPSLTALPHAQELRLMSTSFGGLDAQAEREQAARASTEAIRLEERLGGRTAATAHILGRFLIIQGRYEEALEVLRDGVRLAPRSAPVRINQGMTAWRLGLDDEARRAWGIAIDLQPEDFKPYQNLMWLHLDRGEFEEVEQLLGRAPLGSGPEGERTRLGYLARIETERALRAYAVGDTEAVREHAGRSAALRERAADLGATGADVHAVINAGLLEEDAQGVFSGLARLLREDPLRWRRLGLLLEHMPMDLDPAATAAVREFVQALHDSLAATAAPSAR